MSKTIVGHSHTPAIKKGAYHVGGTVTGRMSYNSMVQGDPKSWGGAMARMGKEFFGDSMCGDCINTKLLGGHDRNSDLRRQCQLCGTVWPGLEPENNRRQAILDQRAKKHGQ